MKYPAYPSYRPNRVGCFEELPDTWTVRRLRFLVHGIDQGWSPQANNMPAEDGEMGVLKLSAVGGGAFYPGENKHLEEVPEGQVILTPKAQDVLMTRANTPALVGDLCYVPQDYPDLIIPDLIYRIRVNHTQVAPRYLMYALLSRAGRAQIESLARGSSASMVKLGQGHLNDFQIPLPPREEQDWIVAFLDWRIGQIDALISKKKTLIEKLKEKRTALVARAVTKGLDPDIPMKDPGVDWLGQVPVNWEVKRLKWAVMMQRGHDLPAEERVDGNVPVVSSSGISAFHDCAVAKAPGIVTGRYGTIGTFHLIEEDYWPLNTTLYSNDIFDNNPTFIRAMLENLAPLFLLNSKKSAVPGVDRNDILSVVVAIPSKEEQSVIAEFIDSETWAIDLMIARVEAVILRLVEYRTALITDAITGKIDVRGVQIPVQP